MRSTLLAVFVLFFLISKPLDAGAQALRNGSGNIGINVGFAQTAYNMKGYDPKSFFPIGGYLTIGSNSLQLGPDFWTSLSEPSFSLSESSGKELYTDNIKDTYFGGMLRAHAGDDPHDFAIIFRAGMGVYFSKRNVVYTDYYSTLIPDPQIPEEGSYKFKNSIGYNGALGVSIPIGKNTIQRVGQNFGNLHLTIEGIFNYNPRDYNNTSHFFTSWGILTGLSYIIFYFPD